ncbi:MAG: hypothetical protein NUW01_07090 [Gemmatimonadaceae bacterium]|nr:hypothetical protein [Gemmatimonadaceae bacterium]
MPLLQVIRGLGAGFGNGASPGARLTTMADQVVTGFYQAMLLDGRGYQVRAGTITTPLTGDVAITDTAAEMCADAATGTTILPFFMQVDIEALGGTLPQVAAKSVATASTSGTAFVPLPLKSDGSAAVTTARVQAAGAVTVTAELATTTPVHYIRTMAVAGDVQATWEPLAAPVLVGPRCFYVQVGSASTGSTYFGNFNYIEVPTLMVNPS